MLDYKIISLSPTQLEQRRRQLDHAGFLAWVSPIVLLCVVYVVRRLGPTLLGLAVGFGSGGPGSVRGISSSRVGARRRRRVSKIQLLYRQTSWILNSTFIPEFGPLQVQLVGFLYGGWLLYVVFRGTGDDYMHLTKAFGHVAVAQLPMQYLLSFKSSSSPVALATGFSHERLNAYHRLLGRIVHLLLAAHALLYLRFFVSAGLLGKRVKDRDVRLGLLGFWLVNLLALLAVPWVRRRAYHRLFYRSHVLISAALVGVLFFHVPYTRRYVLQAGVFWLAGGLVRKRASVAGVLKCEAVEGTQLLKMSLTLESNGHWTTWIPGQHIYLKQSKLGPKNPFTVVQVEEHKKGRSTEIQLVVRNLKGLQTGYLGTLAAENRAARFEIEGPYGEAATYLPRLLQQGANAGQVLVVAGGVGATYAVPVYLSLLKARATTAGIKMVWLVKSLADVSWAVQHLEEISQKVDLEIYVTQPSTALSLTTKSIPGVTVARPHSRPDLARVIEPILTPKSEGTGSQQKTTEVKESYEKITVLVCGPPGLSPSLRTEIGRHVLGYGREVVWYEEQFGLGGS